ncbi:biotin/lipoyl-containing protein, partial [Micrococcus yunnanensis]|uniref:biotin/lipoyl-containing protein n=1 Tax=Micrococcus yunnanensis TaxID=566027 RepID=UPI003CD083B9
MTPPTPVPVTCSRSTPARRAYRRTGGVHRGRSPGAGSWAASARSGSAASGCGRPAPAGAASDVDGACPRAGSPAGAADVETAKAVVEVSSPFAGVVAALHGAEGETLEVGAPLVTFT